MKRNHYENYAEQILKMPMLEAEKLLNLITKINGEEETEKIVYCFSKVGGAI